MIITLEGPDCAGKTTLAKKLEDKYTKDGEIVTILHSKWDKTPSAIIRHFEMMELAKEKHFDNEIVILDRHFPSEYVYQYHFENNKVYGTIKEGYDKHIASFLRSEYTLLEAKIILCFPPLHCVIDSFKKKVDEGTEKFDDIKSIYNIYANLALSTNWFDYIYDYTNTLPSELITYLGETK